jgi:two-component system chemotaxis response regulator CheV
VSQDSFDIKKLHLEVGGSVFELIEFGLSRRVGGQLVKGLYGVNVAKVREVVRMPRINPLASRIRGIPGVFELRGVPIPVVNLAVALGDEDAPVRPDQQVIVTEFSQKRAGFIVDSTHKIRRIAWDRVLPPSSDAMSCMSGMTLVENNEFLFILDLERVLLTLEYGEDYVKALSDSSLEPQTSGDRSHLRPGVADASSKSTQGPRVLLVDDAAFIRNVVRQMLDEAGFCVIESKDGAEAFEVLEQSCQTQNKIDLIISDIEMPRMDGLGLTKKVREHPQLAEIPVILHTSLSGRANQSAGFMVGANGYVIKNDFQALFRLIGELLGSQAPHVKIG